MGFPFFPTNSTKGHKKREGGSKKDRKKTSKPSPRPEHTVSFGSVSSSSSSSSSSSLDSPTTILGRAPADLTRISRAELETALRRLGACDGPELADVLAEADRDGDGWINVEELLQASAGFCLEPEGEVTEDDGGLREAFKVYDLNGDGLISAEELLRVLATLGDSDCSLDDCRRMIGVVDSDGDGFVGFDDFTRMMTVAADAWVVSSGPVLSR